MSISPTSIARASRRFTYGFALAILSVTAMMAGASAPSPFYSVLAVRIGFDAATTTVVFAVYALALLATLLLAGSISDYVGRRPAISAGLVLLAASVFLFWNAHSIALLIAARIVQGIASGLLLSALSAAVIDLEPASRPGSAAVWNAVAPMAGLAVGAVIPGILLDVTPDAFTAVFAPLTALYLVLAALVWLAPETAPRLPGVLASFRIRIGVPRSMRALFLNSVPAIFAGWATGGLFLSLGPSIVHAELGVSAHLWQGFAVSLLAGSGALSAFLIRRRSARVVTIYGTSALAVGTLLTLVALSTSSLVGYFVAVAVAGSGFGTAFFGVIRSLAPHIPATARADVFAVIFMVSYLAMALPVVAAGFLVQVLGLSAVTYGYGVGVAVFAALAAVLRLRRPDARVEPAASPALGG
ncbi:MAG: MFS transporter [Microbacterium sp.]|uniref:MFS transporter n=1 Tax=Microbacterium ginsengisoli TaxID=400772 RepID=A0A0F0M0R0_9MICO|nr:MULTISPECIES: MFS transporter [Microbacterium]MAL07934.1 MFS transporter [Microbacterium sp.]MCK9919883.1 MFS transporter [Microbacteriaceae bacterium K1510]KJL37211.1 Multidrug resistance protein MdtL [Microbacterium ginsengisoli]MBN9209701.1 MFS transporter [Microbacterium ginsengisoli]HAN24384.1 MFS transporter [Microbacterium ginsengisoli]